MLPIFICTERKNYAKKHCSYSFFLHVHAFSFPSWMEHQHLYSQFVNTCGIPVCNIPADLQNEHLNWVYMQ